MTHLVDPKVIEGLREFDSATVFNALVKKFGLPNEEYTDHTIRCLLPELGTVVGYAATSEVTTNDADSPALEWIEYYAYLEETAKTLGGPLIAVMKDVDARPGRGASFGDGMATVHKRLGVVGTIVDGTVRDLVGIRRVGLPIWAWGAVPGHGVFHVTRFQTPVTVGQLRVRPGDLILADGDGCVRIPPEHAAEILQVAGEIRSWEAGIFAFYQAPDFSVQKMRERR
ncbi:MAG: RraA family protein [Caldilineaceae bacterium]|nr:RraA family protein [Caldilineaceae bacterium]